MAIGEAGKLSTDFLGLDQDVRVEFKDTIPHPVVCIRADLGEVNLGDEPHDDTPDCWITACDENGFTLRKLDPPKIAQSPPIQWIAMTRGTHRLPDGHTIIAGQTTPNSGGEEVVFGAALATRPVVLKAVLAARPVGQVSAPSGPDATAAGFIAIAQPPTDEHNAGDHPVHTDPMATIFTEGMVSGRTLIAWDRESSTTRPKQPVSTEFTAPPDLSHNVEKTESISETNAIPDTEPGMIPCFTRDSQIETPSGPRAMRDLRPGDLVVTLNHGLQQVLWISRARLTREFLEANPEQRPIRIRRGALGPGQPMRELVVSPQHRLVITDLSLRRRFGSDRILIPACALLDGDGIDVLPPNRGWTYFHLLLPEHCLILAESCATESLSAQAARALVPSSRFDHLPIWKSDAPLPVVSAEQGRDIWARLKNRSQPRVTRDRSTGSGLGAPRRTGFDMHHSA